MVQPLIMICQPYLLNANLATQETTVQHIIVSASSTTKPIPFAMSMEIVYHLILANVQMVIRDPIAINGTVSESIKPKLGPFVQLMVPVQVTTIVFAKMNTQETIANIQSVSALLLMTHLMFVRDMVLVLLLIIAIVVLLDTPLNNVNSQFVSASFLMKPH